MKNKDTQYVNPEINRTFLTNEDFTKAFYTSLRFNDIDQVFSYVFSHLSKIVHVYPTENYYYFSFFAAGKWFWGNIRLGVELRDKKMINFAYHVYVDDPKSPNDGQSWSKRYGHKEGVIVKKLSDFSYSVSYTGKQVIFNLNEISQEPPQLFRLKNNEEFVARTFDESGFRFFLIFNKQEPHFMWILDEENKIPLTFERLTKDVVFDRLSGFAFYVNKKDKRKILIGVCAQNVRRNNYWDGPFDQLADNFVNPTLSRLIQKTYRYTKNRIDKYGKFIDEKGLRIAITPYREYDSLKELIEIIKKCKKLKPREFYPCICYDYKIHRN